MNKFARNSLTVLLAAMMVAASAAPAFAANSDAKVDNVLLTFGKKEERKTSDRIPGLDLNTAQLVLEMQKKTEEKQTKDRIPGIDLATARLVLSMEKDAEEKGYDRIPGIDMNTARLVLAMDKQEEEDKPDRTPGVLLNRANKVPVKLSNEGVKSETASMTNIGMNGSSNSVAISEAVETTSYTIQYGDTLTAIAAAHGVTVADILDVNGSTITNINNIPVGTEIAIPVK